MEEVNQPTTSVLTGAGLALLSTTCCALPILLVSFGAGGAVASMVSTLPWLASLSEYKMVTFTLTALVLGYSWWRLKRVNRCDVTDGRRLLWQRWVLRCATTILLISVFAAYALLPLTQWWERVFS